MKNCARQEQKQNIRCFVFPSLAYLGIFIGLFVYSFIDNSTKISFLTSAAGVAFIIGYEITNWINTVKKNNKRNIIHLAIFPIVLSFLVLFVLVIVGIALLAHIPDTLPNVITNGSLIVYLVSYCVRSVVKYNRQCRDNVPESEQIL